MAFWFFHNVVFNLIHTCRYKHVNYSGCTHFAQLIVELTTQRAEVLGLEPNFTGCFGIEKKRHLFFAFYANATNCS